MIFVTEIQPEKLLISTNILSRICIEINIYTLYIYCGSTNNLILTNIELTNNLILASIILHFCYIIV